jgi:hypothetical protein
MTREDLRDWLRDQQARATPFPPDYCEVMLRDAETKLPHEWEETRALQDFYQHALAKTRY